MIATVSAGVKPELFLRGEGGGFLQICVRKPKHIPYKCAHLHVSILLINPSDRGYCRPKCIVLSGFFFRDPKFLCPVTTV